MTPEARRSIPGGYAATDLRSRPPRRWCEQLDGIAWLPRLIDKARAARAGTLGTYLYGQSPYDERFLTILGLTHAEFGALVAAAPDDRAVLAALVARDAAAVESVRRWSRGLARRHPRFMAILDMDDGYAAGWRATLRPLVTATCDLVARAARVIRPVRP